MAMNFHGKERKFGALKCKVNYGIRILFNDGDVWVTSISYYPKEFKYEKGKSPFLMSKETAEDVCSGMLCNGYSAFVVEIPDVFTDLQN